MKHTETRIYSTSLELVPGTRAIMDDLPRGYAFLADQLRRSVSSITLNYAEGCGKQHPRDRKRFFVQAKGSANEVMAIIDVAHSFGLIAQEQYTHLKDKADHLAAMLSKFR